MMWEMVKLKEIIESPISGEWGEGEGETKILRTTNFNNDGSLDLSNVVERNIPEKKITQKALLFGDTIIEKSGGSPTQPVGRVVYFNVENELFLCNNFTSVIRPTEQVYSKYLFWFLFNNHLTGNTLKYQNKTTGIINLQLDRYLKEIEIPLPPLSIQQKIAEILDKADALRRKDQALLKKYDDLAQAIFIDMFGDPVKNEMGWEVRTLRGIALKISDGPFGSNLKTEHYKKEGIRVIRLANIGVNEFIDKGAAFISKEHYENVVKKHICLVGDILIATLGEPNPRACEFPVYLEKAVNKADCIMLRINDKICTQSFVSHLINMPSIIESAQSKMHGQTRTRISMSQVAELLIPVPPLKLQKEYANAIRVIEEQHNIFSKVLNQSENLFQSLLQEAFKGELV